MVRLTLLAGVVTALCASMTAPAQAGVLPDDLGAPAAATVTTTVQQTATGATVTVRDNAAAATRETAPAAEPAVRHATAIAQPAAEAPSRSWRR